MEEQKIPVAQYLRMSTLGQRYSIENQRAAIAEYVAANQMVIVQTYTDPGLSGLALKHRPGLRQLLQDVVTAPSFRTVIVYDVSRWGRFQDPDEAAHYEFLCKSAGVPVHYVNDGFANDGSMANVLLKQLKRTMAGEYSRELGNKVHFAQSRCVQMGHRMGSVPGYGLRRCLVLNDGSRRPVDTGEHKALASEWTTLIPGPTAERRVIGRMFQLAANRVPPATIARMLNLRGLRNARGNAWSHKSVTEILTNAKYKGANVWGRTSQRLRTGSKPVATGQWVVREGAFPPVVAEDLFDRVQHVLAERTHRRSDERLLDDLRTLLKRKGRLSTSIITGSRITPSSITYQKRFGSLLQVYGMIGYDQHRDCAGMVRNRKSRYGMKDKVVSDLRSELPERIEIVRLFRHRKPILLIDGCIPCAVTFCPVEVTANGKRRWIQHAREAEKALPTLFCFLDQRNSRLQSMYLCPPSSETRWYRRVQGDSWFAEQIRVRTARQLCRNLQSLASKFQVSNVALIRAKLKPYVSE